MKSRWDFQIRVSRKKILRMEKTHGRWQNSIFIFGNFTIYTNLSDRLDLLWVDGVFKFAILVIGN